MKPYKDISEAIRQYRNDYYLREESIKFVLKNNLTNAERLIIDGTILARVLYTFECFYADFAKLYKIDYEVHSFWFGTTFQLKYNPSSYTFTLHSGAPTNCPPYLKWWFEDTKNLDKNQIGFYRNLVLSYVRSILDLLKKDLPQTRYEYMVKRHHELFDS